MTLAGISTEMVACSDDQLMAQVKAGDVDALGKLYDRLCHRAFRIARSICQQDARAEEAVQEAFISIWRSRRTYEPTRGTPTAWLLSTVRHRAIDLARREQKHTRHRAPQDASQDQPALGDLATEVVVRADASDLRSLLAQLPDTQQEVITLAFYGQLTHTEIADHLNLPPGTVKGRMRLGLHKLRAGIEPHVA